MRELRHGFYSPSAHRMLRQDEARRLVSVQVSSDGAHVVTMWFRSREEGERHYGWSDKRYVGEFDMRTFSSVRPTHVPVRGRRSARP